MFRTTVRCTLLAALAAAFLTAAPPPAGAGGAPEAAPANDAFANAQAISGASGSVTGTNVDATKEVGEPNHTGNTGGASVWFTWTAPATGNTRFDTCTSPDVFALLAVYTGTTVGGLTEVAPGGNTCAPGARVDVPVTAGTTYRIVVDGLDIGASADMGPFTLTWTGPADNDAFADATAISGASGTASGSNVAASEEPGEPDHAGNVGGASVWFTWTAPSTGITRFRTCRADSFDTLLGVYTGTAVGALTPVVAADGGGCGLQSVVDLATSAGTTYRIAIDGFGDGGGTATGTYTLKWAPRPAHGPDLWLRKGTAPWLGDDVYDVTGRTQARSATVRRAGTARFSFRLENEDTIAHTFHLVGTGTSSRFRVTYQTGSGVDVTTGLTEGTQLPLAPGSSLRVDVIVKPRASRAAPGDTISIKVRVTDTALLPMPADAVVARVTLT